MACTVVLRRNQLAGDPETPKHLARLLRDGEGLTVEFKRTREALNCGIYETICAFLNQHGGTLILGAADGGRVTGIAAEALAQMPKDLANTSRVCFSHHLREVSTQSSPHVAQRRSVVMDCLSGFYPPVSGAA